MAPIVPDMSDKKAWDDSLLINSWDEAVNEYKKYHSIHQSGKKLEDVLTEEELKELQGDYGNLMEEAATAPGAAETNGVADHEDTEMSQPDTNGVALSDHNAQTPQQEPQQPERPSPSAEAQPTPDAARAIESSMPQAILGTVQDENMKNVMMSWYYAGYYTGLHAGQQAPKDAPTKQ